MGTPAAAWTRQVGTSSFETAEALSASADGSVVVVGSAFVVDNTTGNRSFDLLLSRFNSDGSLAWLFSDGTNGQDLAHAVATDATGGFYVTGQTEGDLHGRENAGSSDMFLSAYSDDGLPLWTRLLGSTGKDVGTSLYRSDDGSIFVAGSTAGSLPGQFNQGGRDLFVSRYSSDGELQWVRQLGSSGNDSALAIAAGPDGGIVLTGYSAGPLLSGRNTFAPAPALAGSSAFVAHLSVSGDLIWEQRLDSDGPDSGTAIRADSNGNIVVLGELGGALTGAGSNGGSDLFVGSFTPTGAQRWLNVLGSEQNDRGGGLSLGTDNRIYLAATTEGSLDEQPNLGFNDVALMALDSEGQALWTAQLGSDQADFAADLITTADGRLVLAGSSNGSFDGQPHSGTRDLVVHSVVPSTPPQAIQLSRTVVSEHIAAGGLVALLSVDDPDHLSRPDLAENVIFALAEGPGDRDNAAFSVVNNELRINAAGDYEQQYLYELRLRATDAGGLFHEQAILIELTDDTEAPTAISLSTPSVNENSSITKPVSDLRADDPDAGEQHTFSLVSGDGDEHNQLVTIVGSKLWLTEELNYEERSTLNIRVRATDENGLHLDQALTLTVNDVNESPTDIQLSATGFNAPGAAGSAIATISTLDPDRNERFSYSLTRGEGDTDNDLFRINGDQLQVRKQLPDSRQSLSIRIRSVDRYGKSIDRSLSLDINLAPTAISLSSLHFDENLPAGSRVAILSAADANAADTVTYELVSGDGDTDNDSFSVDGTDLRINRSPDYEKKTSYAIRLRGTDPGGLVIEENFELKVNDQEELTQLIPSSTSFQENLAAGSVVASLSTSHPDSSLQFTLTFASGDGDTDNQVFDLIGNQLRIKAAPDHEQQASYFIRLRATDQFGGYTEHELILNTIDLNERPTNVRLSSEVINVGSRAGDSVATLSAIDPDEDDQLTYALADGSGAADNGMFSIAGDHLLLKSDFNTAEKSLYSIRVRAIDKGNLTVTKTITLNANHAPTDIQISASAILENLASGEEIGKLVSIDKNSKDEHIFSLSPGNGDTDNSFFMIEGNRLLLNETADYEYKPVYSVRIKALDPYGLLVEEELSIEVLNELETPQIVPSSWQFSETLTQGDSVAMLRVGDRELLGDAEVIGFSLVAGDGAADNHLFEVTSDQLRLAADLNSSIQQRFSLRLRADLSDGSTVEQSIQLNRNQHPTDVWASESSVNATAPADSVVATLRALDPNATDSFRYALVTGSATSNPWAEAIRLDNNRFRLDNNQLILNDSLLDDEQTSYTIRVRATDQGGLTVDKDLHFERVPAPTRILVSSQLIPEEETGETLVAALFTDAPTVNPVETFSLIGDDAAGDSDHFVIEGDQLFLIDPANHEQQASYQLRIQARFSDGYLLEETIMFNVADVNEAPTAIVPSVEAFEEGTPAGSRVLSLSAVDADVDDVHSFSLATSFNSTNDNSLFELDGNQLVLRNTADYEQQASYNLLIRATDRGGLFTEQMLTINVTDRNESPEDIILSSTVLPENTPAGNSVARLSTVDPDLNDSITFALINSTESVDVSIDNQFFRIVGDQLILNHSPNFEQKASYQLHLRATDTAGLSVEKSVQLQVEDLNEAPSAIEMSTHQINHNAPAGSTVAVLTTLDPDAANVFKYELIEQPGSETHFSIRADKLILNQPAEALQASTYALIIRSIDQGGLEHHETIRIEVEPAPTVITSDNSALSETLPIGSVIAQLGMDGPAAERAYSYRILSENAAANRVALEGNQIRLVQPLDHETEAEFSLLIAAEDELGNTITQELNFQVLNENEPATAITLSNSVINESIRPRSRVAELAAVDPDASDDHSFSLVADAPNTDNDHFYIQAGQLRIKNTVDFEQQAFYVVRLRATDRAGLTFDQDFTLAVDNVNEAPDVIALSAVELAENLPAGSQIASLSALDPDIEDAFTFSLVPGFGSIDNDRFSVTADGLLINQQPDHERQESYTIRLRATDSGGLWTEREFELLINDLNEPPESITILNTGITRATTVGSVAALLIGNDPDAGDQVNFQLVAGEGDRNNQLFTISDDQLLLNSPLQDLNQTSLSIRLRATDSAGLWIERIHDFTLLPTILSNNSRFPESLPAGSSVSTLSVSGSESSGAYIFSLADDTPDIDNDAFALSGNQLILSSTADHEGKDSYTVRILASNGQHDSMERNLQFQVEDVNEAPSSINLSNRLIEDNAPAGTNLATISGKDQDDGDILRFSIKSVNGNTEDNSFSVLNNSLQLNVAASALTTKTFTLKLRATDADGLFYEEDLVLQLAPSLQLSNTTVEEGGLPGQIVGIISSTIASESASTLFSFVDGDGDDDNAMFTIDGDELKIASTADYELKDHYSLRIRAATSDAESIEKNLRVDVLDQNEAPVWLTISALPFAEDAPALTQVAELQTIDPDLNEQAVYSLVDGEGSADNALFLIDGNVVRIRDQANYEQKQSYRIRVQARDRGGLSIEATTVLQVEDRNDAPSAILASASSINRDAPSRSAVASLSTLDEDSGDRHSYSLVSGPGSDDNGNFTILGDKLRLASVLPSNPKQRYSVRVRSTDSAGASVEQVLELNSNEQPESIITSTVAFSETISLETPVLTFSTIDSDADDHFTYSLTAGIGGKDNGKFKIIGSQLLLMEAADYETQPVYSIRIRSTDSGGLSIVQPFELLVQDVNEGPTSITLSKTSLDENAPIGTLVGELTAQDPESAGPITFSLVSGPGSQDNNRFRIQGNQLISSREVDYEAKRKHSIRIKAVDTDGNSSQSIFSIAVNNLIEIVQSQKTRSLPVSADTLQLTGDLNVDGTGNSADNQLIGNDADNVLTGGLGRDVLTGLGGADTFNYEALAHSLLAAHDHITDLTIGLDHIDGPMPWSPGTVLQVGIAPSLQTAALQQMLNTQLVPADSAVVFTVIEPMPVGIRTFLMLNNSQPGYSPSTDALIEITGYTGNLDELAII